MAILNNGPNWSLMGICSKCDCAVCDYCDKCIDCDGHSKDCSRPKRSIKSVESNSDSKYVQLGRIH